MARRKPVLTVTSYGMNIVTGMKMWVQGELWTVIKVNNCVMELRNWGRFRVWLYMRWFYIQSRFHQLWCWINRREP